MPDDVAPKLEMENLVAAQEDYHVQIRKLWSNFQKLAVVKRTPAAIRTRLGNLCKLHESCFTRHDQILAISTKKIRTEHLYFTNNLFDSIVETVDEVRDALNEALEAAEADRSPAPNPTNSADAPRRPIIDLTPIHIPKFAGSYEGWIEFRDIFVALVDARTDLSNIQKFHYLRSSVDGHAARVIRHLQITEVNYQAAWDLLKRRYENPRAILYTHLDAFLTIPRVGSNRKRDLLNLRDMAYEIYNNVMGLSRPINLWEDQFVHFILSKLDEQTRHAWEMSLPSGNIFPTFDQLDAFLSHQVEALCSSGIKDSGPDKRNSSRLEKSMVIRAHQATTSDFKKPACLVCKGDHPLYQCKKFLELTPEQRIALLKKQQRCFNCFRLGHRPVNCNNKNTCKFCHKKHNSLVHLAIRNNEMSPRTDNDSLKLGSANAETVTMPHISANCINFPSTSVILPTASVFVVTTAGRSCTIRALLDQGSQATFISESAFQLLRPEHWAVSINVTSIAARQASVVKAAALLSLGPRGGEGESTRLRAYVLPRLTNYVPPLVDIDDSLPHLQGLDLADASLNTREPVHIIIGADYFGAFLLEGLRKGKIGEPIAQLTSFGWIISGPTSSCAPNSHRIVVNLAHAEDNLNESLARIWELDDVPSKSFPTEEEVRAEEHFVRSCYRLPSGRYSVQLPLKGKLPSNLAESRQVARTMYKRQESRLLSNPPLKSEYEAFLSEYLSLSHMEAVPAEEEVMSRSCYLPHHPVLKEDSASTKVRVVFNASCRVAGGPSLNDHLLVGPKLQADLFGLVLKWRCHQFVISTDLEKMFRQILVAQSDRDLQRIWWRPTPSSELQSFRLCTVTYGTACAPFLANRVLQQLALDERSRFPAAARILEENVYVDDLMFGADDPCALNMLREQHGPVSASEKSIGEEQEAKILGIRWCPLDDSFRFRVTPRPIATSKREFLSLASRLFDPLGWVSPATVVAKIILQSMWLRKIDWDDPLPPDVAKQCNAFQESLRLLADIRIPRWTGQGPHNQEIELHGFCDASNAAYAASIYLKLVSDEGVASVSLLYAKAKVAPLKIQSIPRLELCAATLLTRSLKFVIENMRLSQIPIICWTDSTVVLAWLKCHPSKWKVFVANRVSEILTALPKAQWRHVPSAQNPADCASRGIDANDLVSHSLWWSGPRWLFLPRSEWPQEELESDPTEDLEARSSSIVAMKTVVSENCELLDRCSSWPKLVRIIAYVLRFVNRSRRNSAVPLRNSPSLSSCEIKNATLTICIMLQRACLPHVVTVLSGKRTVKLDKGLLALNLFLDSEGLVRVGGRLHQASLTYNQRFPILLADSPVTRSIIRHFHRLSLHGGLQVTLHLLRLSYWVLKARSLVKNCIRNCTTCVRNRAQLGQQLMSPLPSPRVNPSRPFSHSGVDYAGPFLIRTSPGRGHRTRKAYCVIFVCLAVRAIHLECVSDYSSEGFISAFHRFVSRRGLPSNIYSDNGTNFVGANRELVSNLKIILRDPELQNRFASDGIEWKFIPPAAPHFGGIWEAGVKSVKHHLRRVMGTFTPTFEEFSTLLCRIEGVLNSRPLTPLHDDVESLDVLTPGHFLVGSPLSAPPEPSVLEVNENRLSRWQTIQRITERFWKVWSSDYLNSLQQRSKWRERIPDLRVGDLVLIKHPNLPPCKWELGRIKHLLPGQDGCIRVVEVRTAASEYKRPVTQLCRLPVDSRTGPPPSCSLSP